MIGGDALNVVGWRMSVFECDEVTAMKLHAYLYWNRILWTRPRIKCSVCSRMLSQVKRAMHTMDSVQCRRAKALLYDSILFSAYPRYACSTIHYLSGFRQQDGDDCGSTFRLEVVEGQREGLPSLPGKNEYHAASLTNIESTL
jgi:hypothetical protein